MKTTDPLKHIIERGGEYIGDGARNDVFRANVRVIVDDKRRDITMALRRPKSAVGARKLYDEAKRLEMLRDAGIPVAHMTYRLNEMGTAVCCTDITRGGRNYVFSDTNRTADDDEWENRIADGEILGHIPNGRAALEELADIANACTDAGCELMNADAFYFIIDKQSLVITPSIGDYKHVVGTEREPIAVAANNLNLAREAVRGRDAIFGISEAEIREFFERKILDSATAFIETEEPALAEVVA